MSKRWVRDPNARALVDVALARGWTLEHGAGHLKLRSPHGALIVLAASASDKRAHKNLRALLRRKGLDV